MDKVPENKNTKGRPKKYAKKRVGRQKMISTTRRKTKVNVLTLFEITKACQNLSDEKTIEIWQAEKIQMEEALRRVSLKRGTISPPRSRMQSVRLKRWNHKNARHKSCLRSNLLS